MTIENLKLKNTSIDLRDNTNEEKLEIFNFLKRCGYKNAELDKWADLIGERAFEMKTCFWIIEDRKYIEPKLQDFMAHPHRWSTIKIKL